jgi:hypothetical protein
VRFTPKTIGYRRYLDGCLPSSRAAHEDAYRRWRATVPWTDAQVIAVIRQAAAEKDDPFYRQKLTDWANYLETVGHITAHALSFALPALVTHCGCCHRKALYRTGNSGRCSVHRDVPDAKAQERQARLTERSQAIQRHKAQADTRDLGHAQARTVPKLGGRRR